jgi:tRNA pseudouridine38-40 synthase
MDEQNTFYYQCIVTYLGSDFNGWQSQSKDSSLEPNANIQGLLQEALYQITESKDCIVAGTSRTDKGVHAWKQPARLAIPREIPPKNLQANLNHLLPKGLKVYDLKPSSENFTPGSTSSLKTYRYYFSCDEVINPMISSFVTKVNASLDIQKMKEGLDIFVGEKDFTNFFLQSTRSPSSVRNIEKLSLRKWNEPIGHNEVYYFEFEARGFLKQMIRMIVAYLFLLGRAKISEKQLREKLGAEFEQPKIKAAPAIGLHLVDIRFFDAN